MNILLSEKHLQYCMTGYNGVWNFKIIAKSRRKQKINNAQIRYLLFFVIPVNPCSQNLK